MMERKRQNVVVTGANGFLGAALCKALGDRGNTVFAVVRNKESNVEKLKELDNIRIVYCELEKIRDLPKYIENVDIDVLYHFAWEGTSGYLRGDSDVQLSNVRYTCELIKTCVAFKCKRFVFASSIMEYEIEAMMLTESTLGVNNIYSSAKLAANHMARILANSLNIEYIRAIISNIYGPGETSPRLINTSIRKLLAEEHCSFSPGEQMYDFIYIDDAVKAFVAIGENGKPNKNYYIGSQEPKPLKQFLYELGEIVAPNIKLGIGDLPYNGPSLSYTEFDLNAVKNDTGFVPEVSFSQGIKNTISWLKEVEKC